MNPLNYQNLIVPQLPKVCMSLSCTKVCICSGKVMDILLSHGKVVGNLSVKMGGRSDAKRENTYSLYMVFWKCSFVILKQRWIKELENESCSGSIEDGTESTSSQQSTSSRSTPNPLSTGTAIPACLLATCLRALTLRKPLCVHIYIFCAKNK